MRTLIGPFKQIVTMEGLPPCGSLSDNELQITGNGGILIEGERIIEIAAYSSLIGDADHFIKIPAPAVALPGLIDAHTHLCWAGSRADDYAKRLSGISYQTIAAAGGGILDTVKKTRQASIAELAALTATRATQLVKQGVTTCEVKSGYGLSRSEELKILRAIKAVRENHPLQIVPTCLAAHLRPPEWRKNRDYLHLLADELLPLVRQERLAARVDIFIEQGAFSVDEGKEYLLRAKELGFDVTVHADQFSRGGAQLAAEIGALSADHLEVSETKDIHALKKARVIPVVLPGASIGLGVPFAPARKILDANLPLVIASDWNPGSAPMGKLLLQAAIIGAYEKLSIAETFAAITCRAALALKQEDRGILARGKRADIAVFSAQNFTEILYRQGAVEPLCTFISGLPYRFKND